MTVLTLTLTDKGKAAVKTALAAGKNTEITQVAFGSNGYSPNKGQTALQKEVVRLSSVVGKAASANMLHLDIQDDSTRSYTVREIGVYLKDGTLFALYAQKEVIFEKSAAAIALLTLDIALDDINANRFTFGGMSFTTPPATINTRGVVMLSDSVNDTAKDKAATANAVKQANDNANRRETPSGAQGKVNAHASAPEAHHAKQIVAIPTAAFPGMKNVQSILNALGDAARKTVGTQKDNVMPVGAFGIGGSAILLGSNDTLQGITQSGLYCVVKNTPKDWPKEALNYALVHVNYANSQNTSFIIVDCKNTLLIGSVSAGKMNPWQTVTMQDQLAKLAFTGQWQDLANKPVQANRWATWNEVGNKPKGVEAQKSLGLHPLAVSGKWADIVDKPAYATRWANWNEVSSKPKGVEAQKSLGLHPLAASGKWADVIDKPAYGTRWATWNEVSGKPKGVEAQKSLGLHPLAVSGKWADLADKPVQATRWANWNEVGSKPKGAEAQKSLGLHPLAASGKWADVADKPAHATRWANWSEVSGKPKGVAAQSSLGLGSLATQSIGSELPIGSPIAWPTDTPPPGWLLCNGAKIDAIKCPILAAVYGRHLPDLRGYFIRGKDDNRAILSKQEDQLRHHQHAVHLRTNESGEHQHHGETGNAGDHRHRYWDYTYADNGQQHPRSTEEDRPKGNDHNSEKNGTFYNIYRMTDGAGNHKHGFATNHAGKHIHLVDGNTEGTGGNETRPRNIAFNYIVRAA